MRLYPAVAETLLKIKGAGAAVVGYTESMGFYSNYRVRRLGLDGVLDYVFSPKDHDIPQGISRDDIRKYPAAHYKFRYTTHRHTPKGSLKPDQDVLLSIIANLKVDRSECVYIGDSPTRDVAMAQDAGVSDVYARYGRAQHLEPYQLLREVTHWTDARVQHERHVDERNVQANTVLEHNFGQLLDHFEFGDWDGR